MYTISKEFHFSAAHQLYGLPDDHPCSRLHGHNYIVRVFLRSDRLSEVGFVKDYRRLDPIKRFIDDEFDHQNLNEIIGDSLQTSAENIAWFIYHRFKKDFPEICAVEVSETPKTNARYEE